jgi:hypothetical protein
MPQPQQQKLSLRDRRRRMAWVKVAAGTSVVAISFLAVFYTARLPALAITAVEVKGTHLVSGDALKRLVEEKLKGSYGFIIPHRNTFLFPQAAIRTGSLKQFPALANITFLRNGLNTLTVTAEERKTVAFWCGDASSGNASSTSCYQMDKNGFIFTDAVSQDGYVRFYGQLSGEPVGSRYLDGAFASLKTTIEGIGTVTNHIPAEVVVDSASNDVALTFEDGGILKFVRSKDNASTLENIASVFASQNFKTKKDFEYVDFRFGDKVYVKFKGE